MYYAYFINRLKISWHGLHIPPNVTIHVLTNGKYCYSVSFEKNEMHHIKCLNTVI